MTASPALNTSEVGNSSKPNVGTAEQWHEKLSDGTSVLIRSIRENDLELERKFISRLSQESRRFRFLCQMSTPSETLLNQLTHPDPKRDVAFVALIADGAEKTEIGVARFSLDTDGFACECAVTVADEWHHRGLATLLMGHLIDVARRRGIRRMYSFDTADNTQMYKLADDLGFSRKTDPNDNHQVVHTLELV